MANLLNFNHLISGYFRIKKYQFDIAESPNIAVWKGLE